MYICIDIYIHMAMKTSKVSPRKAFCDLEQLTCSEHPIIIGKGKHVRRGVRLTPTLLACWLNRVLFLII